MVAFCQDKYAEIEAVKKAEEEAARKLKPKRPRGRPRKKQKVEEA